MPANPRSYLFVPGNRPERFARAAASGAGAVIVDLEDAVPPADKDAARMQVAAALDPSMPVVVRINAEDTPWFEEDLALCRHAGVAAIMLPKAASVENLQRVAQLGLPVLPLIETACGMAAVDALEVFYRLRLRQHDGGHARVAAQGQVILEPGGVFGVDAHDDGVGWIECCCHLHTRGVLVCGWNGIFQVDDDRAGAAGRRPGETFGAVARDEQVGTGDGGHDEPVAWWNRVPS